MLACVWVGRSRSGLRSHASGFLVGAAFALRLKRFDRHIHILIRAFGHSGVQQDSSSLVAGEADEQASASLVRTS